MEYLSSKLVTPNNKEKPISIPHADVIRDIQSQSGSPYNHHYATAFLATQSADGLSWCNYSYGYNESTLPFNGQPPNCNLYFTPLVFDGGDRLNSKVDNPGVLFADLDLVHPANVTIRPTVAWETSPGSYQAVWYLDEQIPDYETWANLNKRLTVSTGADVGGWAGSKVLRVPGSYNYKRNAPGKLLWWNKDLSYSVEMMQRMLPVLPSQRSVTGAYPKPLAVKERDWYLGLHWNAMTLQGQSMVTRFRVPDRSMHMVRTAAVLSTTLPAETVFQLLWLAPTNKFRTDRYAPELLWDIVQRAQQNP